MSVREGRKGRNQPTTKLGIVNYAMISMVINCGRDYRQIWTNSAISRSLPYLSAHPLLPINNTKLTVAIIESQSVKTTDLERRSEIDMDFPLQGGATFGKSVIHP